jgi:beta-glucosidase
MARRIPHLRLRVLGALLAALVAAGVTGVAAAVQAAPTPDARARAIVAKMTLDEKITELHGIGGASPDIRKVPGISRLGIPAFVITNGPAGATNGTVKPVPPATALPAPVGLAATWDVAAAGSYGQVMGAEARRLGNELLEGPDMNMARVPQNGRTFENLGEDPFLAGQVAVADIQGIQAKGEIAEAKHYLGNEQEANRFHLNDTIDERTMREIYLAPFEASVTQGHVGAVMCAYPQVNGTFSCENGTLLNSILKGEWRFDGVVTSDFGAVHSTVPSALNGLDLEMPSGKFFNSALKSAVQSGRVPVATIDDKLVRRFRKTMELGLWDSPPSAHSITATQERADGAVARAIAAEGVVLLKNAGSRLPLGAGALRSIAVIGPFAGAAKTGGGGSSAVVPLHTVTPVAGIKSRAGSGVTVTFDDGSSTSSAAAAARAADVAVVMVGDAEAEGKDHPISLSGNQDALVSAVAAANPSTVVVVKSGSAVLMPWAGQVPAILEAWYPGEEDGNAVADVLFGAVNPSGRLPMTFPRQLADLPANTPSQYPSAPAPAGTIAQAHYSEGLLMGYRAYDAHGVAPLFPFGFGLSYTTFSLANLAIAPGSGGATVGLDVKNTGKRSGAQVVQVYVGQPAAAGEPPRVLAGFQRVSLAPGQTGHVSIALGARAFSHWDSAGHRWAVTPGAYQVLVGTSSRDIALQGTVNR